MASVTWNDNPATAAHNNFFAKGDVLRVTTMTTMTITRLPVNPTTIVSVIIVSFCFLFQACYCNQRATEKFFNKENVILTFILLGFIRRADVHKIFCRF